MPRFTLSPTEIYSNAYIFIAYVVNKLLLLFEAILALRLLLKFLGANTEATAIALFYGYTDIPVAPFQYIFPDIFLGDFVIETATISAMIGYAILVTVILQIIKLFSKYS